MKNNSKLMCVLSLTFLCSISSLLGCSKISDTIDNLNSKEVSGDTNGTISLTFPINDERVHILKPRVLSYIDAMHEQAKDIENDYILHDFYVHAPDTEPRAGEVFSNETDLIRIKDYTTSLIEEKSKVVTLAYDTKGIATGSTFNIKLGTKADLSDAKELSSNKNFVTVDNLLANTKYYWQVSYNNTKSEVASFITDDGFRMISNGGVANIRDMGGRPVYGGKHIKQGLIYRGGELVEEKYKDTKSGATHYKSMDAISKAYLQDELGIKLEIDFRGIEESNFMDKSALYDDNHKDIDYLHIPQMAGYDYIFNMNSETWSGVKDMFLAFKNANDKPVYFHCWGGADRTGTAGFLLGALLGMSYTDLIIDFELTSYSGNYRPHNIIDSNKIYRFPSLIAALLTLKKKNDSSSTYFAINKPISTIVEEILIDYAGLTSQDISDIRTNLLED